MSQKSAEVIKNRLPLHFFDSILCMVQPDSGVYAPAVEQSSNHYGK